MRQADPGILSFSLAKLRRLTSTFADLMGGRPVASLVERAALRLVDDLGATALPVLCRELAGLDDDRARWAHALLARLAGHVTAGPRVHAELRRVVTDGSHGDRVTLRALTLLTELGVRLETAASLSDPDAARDRSLFELAGCLTSPAEVARATDHLLGELDLDDLEAFVTDLVQAQPGPAGRLVDELLVRDDLPGPARAWLRDLRVTAGRPAAHERMVPSRRRPTATLCRHDDGRRILVVAARADGRPARLRVLCALIAADGRLVDAHHADDLVPGGLERTVLAPLGDKGFTCAPLGLNAARGCLIQAARTALVAGVALPREFYLGRDLIGLTDEHLDGTGRRDVAADRGALLGCAIALLRAGEHGQARPLLERYVVESPDDPEGHAQLGVCLLGLGDAAAARHHLGRAAFLEPDDPLVHWNLAAAAHRALDLDACCDSLLRYLGQRDVAPGAEARRDHAARLRAEIERLRHLREPARTAVVRRRARRVTSRRRSSPR